MTRDPLLAAFASGRTRCPQRPVVVAASRPPLLADALDALAYAVQHRLGGGLTGALVGVASPGGVSFLSSVLTLRRAGAAVLLLDPGGPVVAQRRTAAALGAVAVLECSSPWPEGPEEFHLEPIRPGPDAPPLPRETAFVKTTSGSTGRPRGVAVSSEAVLADEAALAASMEIDPHDRIVAAVPMSHSYGFTSVVLHALVRGATIVMPEPGPLGPVLAAERVEATVFPTVPAYLGALLKMSQPPPWPGSVRLVVSAGAPLLPEVARRFRTYSGRGVHVFYGASECGGICFDREGRAAERGTVGTPVEGVQVSLDLLSDVEEGLAVVASRAVASCYVPEPDPDRLGAGRFHTSDVARWQGGELQLLRRVDTLINVKGKKVDPAEIEMALGALSGVEEVVALGITDPTTGGHTLRVVIACQPGRLTAEDVLRFCRTRLADHQIPRSIRLVSQIPRTDRGKIDRGALVQEA